MFKLWLTQQIDTPDKARNFLCNVALVLGVIGAVFMIVAFCIAKL